ncbi:MAG: hypothetical protein RhofKO_13280 [Rhodothermales bacterium]
MRNAVWSLLAVFALAGCSYYSFTGATIPSHLGTIAIPLVEDRSVSTVSTLSDDFTEALIDRFVNQTRLSLEPLETNADAVLNVTISRYENRPTSVGGNERAALNRVTLFAQVRYMDQVEDEVLLETSLSAFGEYDPAEGLDGETSAAQDALQNLADDVFTRATSNW